MFYSNEKELLFIHIPKTAGTSLKIALKPFIGNAPETVSSHLPLIEHIQSVPDQLRARGMVFPNHMTIRDVEMYTNIDPHCVNSFSVVRNPWTRLSSLYKHIARDPTHALHDLTFAREFKSFLAALLDPRGIAKAPDTLPQIEYLLDTQGSVGVRTLLKQETLEPGLRRLCEHVGIYLDVPRSNVCPENVPELQVDSETREMIAVYEAGIIRLLRYSETKPEGLGGSHIEIHRNSKEAIDHRTAPSPRADNQSATASAMRDLRLGRFAKAAADLEAALEAKPDDPIATHFLGLAHHNLNDHQTALRLVKKSVELQPEQPDFLRNLGSLLKLDGAYSAAADALERALQLAPENAEAWALLCEVRYRMEQPSSAQQAGQRALEIKDQLACAIVRPSSDFGSSPPFDPRARRRNIIAMSLFGPDSHYHEGARLNAQLARVIYPEWMCRFYCDAAVPMRLIEDLLDLGAQVIRHPKPAENNEALFWRFRVANDPDADRFLCRDCDSPLTVRERVAVEEWISSGKLFHVIRDHVMHSELILAGLWGGVTGLLPNMNDLAAKQSQVYRGRWADQQMLGREIWPRIRDHVMVHDSHYRVGPHHPFPRFGTIPAPLHAGYSRPRLHQDGPGEFQQDPGSH